MKASDLKERSSEDLQTLKAELKREMFSAKMKNHTGQLTDTSAIGKARRDVARIEGILRARASEASSAEGSES